MSATETIFAVATGRLPSGIAIVRISGPEAAAALELLTGTLPPPRTATYRRLAVGKEVLDHGIALFFPGPGSVTGEDCAELHIHGSVAVAKAVSAALAGLPRCRPAEPGEFTRRAFLNGRMDLTGVESLSDLIAAETDQQRRLALTGVAGRIRDMCLGWRSELQTLRALVEADLDFSDQDDVEAQGPAGLDDAVCSLVARMASALERADQAEIVRHGYTVAIIGAPNAGKSSLLNALAMRDVAIVTAEPGTTRDVVEVALDIGGYKVLLRDTAGLREADTLAERIGVARAREAAEAADLVLLVEDSAQPIAVDVPGGPEVIRVGTKSDLDGNKAQSYDVLLSVVTGDGLAELLKALAERVAASAGDGGDLMAIRSRHAGHIRQAVAALQRIRDQNAPELIAEELRTAAVEIGRVVGIGDTEELLGEIFARFCIGK